jgi:hypothetical protein
MTSQNRDGRGCGHGSMERVVLGPYELAQAPDALAALPTTHTRGKLAIRVP